VGEGQGKHTAMEGVRAEDAIAHF